MNVFKYCLLIIHQAYALQNIQCPIAVSRSLRSTLVCSSKNDYHCLFDCISSTFIETCAPMQPFGEGLYAIFCGNIATKQCENFLYSPTSICTNEGFQCSYHKSRCNEEGQLIADYGTMTTDTSCQCNFISGYDYVSRPKNPCRCIPTLEDCSCYKRKCGSGDNTAHCQITPAYICPAGISNTESFLEDSNHQIKPMLENKTTERDDNIAISKILIFLTLVLLLAEILLTLCWNQTESNTVNHELSIGCDVRCLRSPVGVTEIPFTSCWNQTESNTVNHETEYEIYIWTSDKHGAGTDADVYIQIIGSEDVTDQIQLGNTSNNFERGQEDKFTFQAKDVGTIEKIKIGHDGSNPMSGWHLNKILVKKKIDKFCKDASNPYSNEGTPVNHDTSTTIDYWFHVNLWFDTSEGDGAIERELVPTDETENQTPGSPNESSKTKALIPSTRGSQRSNVTDRNDTVNNRSRPVSEKSKINNDTSSDQEGPVPERNQLTYINDRSNNREDPFYIASAYDKDPKNELQTLYYHRQPEKPNFISEAVNKVEINEMSPTKLYVASGVTSQKSGTADRSTRMTNIPQGYSPIDEEDAQPVLAIHTEDENYFSNDFQETKESGNKSPSALSLYFKDEVSKGAIGSIKRTLQLFN